ncbi:hypothetical protein Btru_023884 [Bulinus truncatus]|nr:hypothetical protein Btru_023884 [Bulinus truncatus]
MHLSVYTDYFSSSSQSGSSSAENDTSVERNVKCLNFNDTCVGEVNGAHPPCEQCSPVRKVVCNKGTRRNFYCKKRRNQQTFYDQATGKCIVNCVSPTTSTTSTTTTTPPTDTTSSTALPTDITSSTAPPTDTTSSTAPPTDTTSSTTTLPTTT